MNSRNSSDSFPGNRCDVWFPTRSYILKQMLAGVSHNKHQSGHNVLQQDCSFSLRSPEKRPKRCPFWGMWEESMMLWEQSKWTSMPTPYPLTTYSSKETHTQIKCFITVVISYLIHPQITWQENTIQLMARQSTLFWLTFCIVFVGNVCWKSTQCLCLDSQVTEGREYYNLVVVV